MQNNKSVIKAVMIHCYFTDTSSLLLSFRPGLHPCRRGLKTLSSMLCWGLRELVHAPCGFRMHQALCEWEEGSGYDSVVQCLLSVCMLCLGCAEGSGLHPQCGGNKGDATAMVTTNLTGLYGMADAGVKQSLWKVVCVSSDMLAAFLRGPITLTESPVKATAFLLQLQIHSDRQLFWAGWTFLGWVAEC